MKKATSIGSIVLFTVFLASCTPASSIKAGSATAESLIRLLPKTTLGVIAIDVHRGMGLASVSKMLQDPQAKQKYDEFIKMAGLDPMKDIYFVVMGLTATPNATSQEGGVIVNLKYSKDSFLAIMKEKAPEFQGESYNGVTIYSNLDGSETKQTTRAAFLDDSNILFGSAAAVKGIVDVYQKKAESVMKNAAMAGVLKKVDKAALAWGAFSLPPDLVKKGMESIPQLKVLEGVTALTLSFDYRLSNFIADIRTMGGTEEQNKNLASTLNGLKGLGAMLAAQEPAAGELLNAVEVTSGKDFVRLYISVSEETMDKLGKAAQAKVGDFMKTKKDAPAEEKPAEKPEVKK
ncbi:MAG: hypothetical protein MUQ25_05320 [Candidatus Aminicenantes bacterium]|nr:hypothetical protein [Candidatus Aminicenantes bacterium]